MNEPTLTRLKVIVERAVRPVRASTDRKRKIREELLAHVSAVYEEESARLGDEQTALARAEERFGNPAELTTQLQEAVPSGDRLMRGVEALVGHRPGESALCRAARHALVMFAIIGALFLPVMIVQERWSEWPFPVGAALLVFGFTLASNGMRQAIYRPSGRSWPRILVAGTASGLLIPAVTFGVCYTITGNAWLSLTDVVPLLLPAVALTPFLVWSVATMAAGEIRYRQEWASLQLD